jgi:hypothetical protein
VKEPCAKRSPVGPSSGQPRYFSPLSKNSGYTGYSGYNVHKLLKLLNVLVATFESTCIHSSGVATSYLLGAPLTGPGSNYAKAHSSL